MSTRAFAAAALLVTTALAGTASAAEPGDAVVPGMSIGKLRLGMSEAEASAALGGLPVVQGWAAHVRRIGPWEVDLNNGKIVRIASTPDHTRPLLIGVTALDLSDLERAAEGIGGCGAVQHNRGGDLIVCAKGVRLGRAPNADTVTVSVVPPGAPLPGGPTDVSSAIRATTVPGANHAAGARIDPNPLPVYTLRPGHSLGPIRLGMTEAEVRALDAEHPVRPGFSDSVLNVGHFEVQLSEGRVVRVSVMPGTLGTLVKYGDTGRDLPKDKLEAVAEVIGGCGPIEHLYGGDRVVCPGGVQLYRAGLNPNLRFSVTAEATTASQAGKDLVVCDAYAHLGEAGHRIEVSGGQTICVDSKAVPQATVLGDIVGKLGFNTCDKVAPQGDQPGTVTCGFDGVRFVFGGANGTLSAVEGVAVRTP